MLLLLLACQTASDPRALAIVGDDADTAAPADTGGFSTTVMEQGTACGDGDPANDPVGDDLLALDRCTRVTPEAPLYDHLADTGGVDTGPVGTGDPGDDVPAPPCGTENMVGDLAVGGETSAPLVLYCDSDADGGTRLAALDGAGGLATTAIAPGDCSLEPASGALVAVTDGWLALWSTETGAGVGGLLGAVLAADGRPVDTIDALEPEVAAHKLAVVPGEPALVLMTDLDGSLWALPLQSDGAPAGVTRLVADGVRALSAVRVGDEVRAAVCLFDDSLEVWALGADGARLGRTRVEGATCGWAATPSVATDGATLLVAWDDGDLGALAWFDRAGVEVERAALGEGATFPAVVWSGAQYLSLDALGALAGWSVTGDALGERFHPGIVGAPGQVMGVRLAVGGGRLLFTLLGLDLYAIGGGHVNQFNYVEVSGTPMVVF